MVFAVAHIGATVTAFVVIAASVVVAPGWSHRLWIQPDYGASAGLVGIAGALFVILCSQRRSLAARVVGAFADGGNDGVLPARGRRRGGTGSRHRRRRAPARLAHRRRCSSGGTSVERADAYSGDGVLAATFRRHEPRGAGVERPHRGAPDGCVGRREWRGGGGERPRTCASATPGRAGKRPRATRAACPSGRHAATALGGLAVILVARGLARRRALSWWLTLGLLGVLGLAHLLKGFDVTAFTMTVSIIVLLLQGASSVPRPVAPHPVGPVRRRSRSSAPPSCSGYGFAGMLIRRDEVQPALTAGRGLEQLASNLVGLAGPLRFEHHFGQWFPKTLTFIGVVWLFALGVALFAPGRHRRGQFSERRHVAVLVAQPNSGTLDPFALRRDRSYLFDRTGNGAVAFRVSGRRRARRWRSARRDRCRR